MTEQTQERANGPHYVIIGARYSRYTTHPSGRALTGRGWTEIVGCSTSEARSLANVLLRDAWSALYTREEWEEGRLALWYPEGCQLRVIVTAEPDAFVPDDDRGVLVRGRGV